MKRDKKTIACSNCGGYGHNRRKCPEISIGIEVPRIEKIHLPEEKGTQRKKRKQSAAIKELPTIVHSDIVPLVVGKPDESSVSEYKIAPQEDSSNNVNDITLYNLDNSLLEEAVQRQPRFPVMTKKLWEDDVSRLLGVHIPIEIRSTEVNRRDGKRGTAGAGAGVGLLDGEGDEGGGNGSTNYPRHFLRKHCMICRHNTSVCCEQCNTYLCIKESVNKGWNCWKLFHTCKNIVDSEYIPVCKRLK